MDARGDAMNDLLKQLAEPFPPEAITWKPGKATKDGSKCMALAYADLRAYMERLDAICGMDWSIEYKPWGESRIIACLTIHGVTRCSTGEMAAQDEKNEMGGTVAEAQAAKRACAMFGLGRSLYDLPSEWVEFDAQSKRITDNGKRKLDAAYRAWYTRQTSQKPQEAPTGTREEISTAAHESPPHQRLWGIGKSVFGNDWDMARAWLITKWTVRMTPDNTRDSASELTNDEKTQLGDYMNENAAALQKVWPKQKAAMLQSTGQPDKVAA
jgi:hypothetical protein